MKRQVNMNNQKIENVSDFLKALSRQDFLKIGMHEIAYIRPFQVAGLDHSAFAVYAADGTQLSVLDTLDMAIATVRHNDLMPVTLH